MAGLRMLREIITGQTYLLDGTGRRFRRTVCALAWPWGPRPGCVVVLGELAAVPSIVGGVRHVHVLAESREESPAALIEQAGRYLRLYHTPRIVTAENDERIRLLDAENDRRRRERQPRLRAESPVAWKGRTGEGSFAYYMSLLRARVVEGKSLFFGPGSSIPAEAGQVSEGMESGSSMAQWPGLCALAWALESLDTGRGDNGRKRRGQGGPADTLGGY